MKKRPEMKNLSAVYDPVLYAKLMISELHMIPYVPGKDAGKTGQKNQIFLSRSSLQKALTINEELLHAGFTLKPDDVARLAASPEMDSFAELIREALPAVKAKPMYPDFPKQVMEMKESEFRFHQLVHYFSTYGMEFLTGDPVIHGWLPDVKETEKTKPDETLLKASLLELVPENDSAGAVFRSILGKRERMTLPGEELVSQSLLCSRPEDLAGISIPFKENLRCVFRMILAEAKPGQRVELLRQLCRHTGDVLASIDYLLPACGFHLRTTEKRTLVKLLESYPVQDFRANLILSRKKGERNLIVLKFLDYNEYSRSAPHREAVADLRSGKLRSWEAQAKCLLESGDEGALDFIAARPGMLLRMTGFLLGLGYSEETLSKILCEKAGALSMHTVVSALNALDAKEEDPPTEAGLERRLQENERRYWARPGIGFARTKQDIHKRYKIVKESHLKQEEMKTTALKNSLKSGKITLGEYLKRRQENSEKYRREIRRLDEAERWFIREKLPYFKNNLDARERMKQAGKRAILKRYASRVRSMEYVGSIRRIFLSVIETYFREKKTALAGKRVYVDFTGYLPEYSRIEAGQQSAEGGYIPSGIAWKIPDGASRVRLFVYWNDKERVDIDLHAAAYGHKGELVHIGWNGDYNKSGLMHSGDITHSNAAEYIDIDLENAHDVRMISAVLHLYDGKPSFKMVDTCFAGLLAVKKLGENVKLYNPANCFFSHEIRSDLVEMRYAVVDVENRMVMFTGNTMISRKMQHEFASVILPYSLYRPTLSLDRYTDLLLKWQGAEKVSTKEEADIVLTLEKTTDEKGVALIEHDYFLMG